jgi:riboflavin synthase
VFTGIVETVGAVVSMEPAGDLVRITIDAGEVAEGVRIGDSIAVNGGCLTVTGIDGPRLAFEAVRETQQRTALADLAAGAPVNLERAMRADGRLDGHIVQGHVDGVGTVRSVKRVGDDVRLCVECGEDLAGAMVEKGSVAIDGVSLTVAGVSRSGFEVALIPHTLDVTTLGARRPGDRVNLEVDVLGKYVKRHVERILSGSRDQTPR